MCTRSGGNGRFGTAAGIPEAALESATTVCVCADLGAARHDATRADFIKKSSHYRRDGQRNVESFGVLLDTEMGLFVPQLQRQIREFLYELAIRRESLRPTLGVDRISGLVLATNAYTMPTPNSRSKKPSWLGWAKCLNLMVAWGGIEPPTRGFSIRCSTN